MVVETGVRLPLEHDAMAIRGGGFPTFLVVVVIALSVFFHPCVIIIIIIERNVLYMSVSFFDLSGVDWRFPPSERERAYGYHCGKYNIIYK